MQKDHREKKNTARIQVAAYPSSVRGSKASFRTRKKNAAPGMRLEETDYFETNGKGRGRR